MLQAVVGTEERDENEMHYTSVPNILKVINPLFIDDLNRKFEDAENLILIRESSRTEPGERTPRFLIQEECTLSTEEG